MLKYLGDKSALNLAIVNRGKNSQLQREVYIRDMRGNKYQLIYACGNGRLDILDHAKSLFRVSTESFLAKLEQPINTAKFPVLNDSRKWEPDGPNKWIFLLHIACWCGHSNAVQFLLKHHVNIHALSGGVTALHLSTNIDCVSQTCSCSLPIPLGRHLSPPVLFPRILVSQNDMVVRLEPSGLIQIDQRLWKLTIDGV